MAESKQKLTTKKLLEKIPVEKCWKMTAKALLSLSLLRGVKNIMPLLGKGEGFISPVMGLEKFQEIIDKALAETGKRYYPWVKQTFNISVEDAIGAVKLAIVAGTLQSGPENEYEIVEATPERAVLRTTKCAWWERYKEFEVDPEHVVCPSVHQSFAGDGFKEINPKIIYKLKKSMQRRDPFCESIIEFKEE